MLIQLIKFLSLNDPPLYIDPSTGGMLFQILAVFFAFFSGILFFFSRQIKSGIARLRRYLSDRLRNSDSIEEEESNN